MYVSSDKEVTKTEDSRGGLRFASLDEKGKVYHVRVVTRILSPGFVGSKFERGSCHRFHHESLSGETCHSGFDHVPYPCYLLVDMETHENAHDSDTVIEGIKHAY